MNHFLSLSICVAALSLTACSSASQKEGHRSMAALVEDSLTQKGPQRMPESEVRTELTLNGKNYVSLVNRKPDTSLPMITNEQGEQFVDNRITLQLSCQGRTVLRKEFTKDTFASLVEDRFMQYAILEGLVFNKTTPQGFVYAASVCYPQSDLYVPLRITISPDGKIELDNEDLLEE